MAKRIKYCINNKRHLYPDEVSFLVTDKILFKFSNLTIAQINFIIQN